jgi:hypothetical protein
MWKVVKIRELDRANKSRNECIIALKLILT